MQHNSQCHNQALTGFYHVQAQGLYKQEIQPCSPDNRYEIILEQHD